MSRRSAELKLNQFMGRVHVYTCACARPVVDPACAGLRRTLHALVREGWKNRYDQAHALTPAQP